MARKGRIFILLSGALAVGLLLLILTYAYAAKTHRGDLFWPLNMRTHRMLDQLSLGLSADSVREISGEPQRVLGKESIGASSYIEGYAYKDRPITNEAWVYFGRFDCIVYVYFDEDMQVEDIFAGGS